MSTPEQPEKNEGEFHFDLLESGPPKNHRPVGIIVASIVIIFIIATMSTNVATTILPMSDEYMNAIVPTSADGKEALSLQKLEHVTSAIETPKDAPKVATDTTTVQGVVGNRTEYPLKDVRAVVEFQDRFGFPHTVESPLDPPELAVQGTAAFTATATLEHGLGGYVIRFRIVDGPFVPHKDDRAAAYVPPATPAPQTPVK